MNPQRNRTPQSPTMVDVVIVGAGMVGLALANGLAQKGFAVMVVDKQQPTFANRPGESPLRVSAINLASQHFLHSLNAWPEHSASGYQHMYVWDENSQAELHFSAREVGQKRLGAIVENAEITRALLAQSTCEIKVACINTLQLKKDGWEVELEGGEYLKTRLLIGADGAQSKVREQLGIELCHRFSGQSALVGVVKTAKPHQQTAYQRFLSTGPVAFLPLKNAHECSFVWTLPSARAEELLQSTPAFFLEQLTQAYAAQLGKVELLSQRLLLPLNRQLAARFVHTQAALVGDAAHVIHPLAGQGVNVGFADAVALINLVTRAKQQQRPFYTPGILAHYQRLRYGPALEMLLALEGIQTLFSHSSRWLKVARGVGGRMVDRCHYFKVWCMRQALGTLSND